MNTYNGDSNESPYRHDLSHGLIECTITTESPLPAAAYAVLAGLVEEIERFDEQLIELIDDAT